MNRIAPTIRARLTAISLVLGASAIIGAATSGPAIASPLDPAPSSNTTSAAARKSCPVGSVCRAARECPRGRVCLWRADHFFGAKKVVRPVPSGKCRYIGDATSPFNGWRSVYNASLEFARLWEFGIGLETGNPTFGGTRCEGRNNLVAPHTARRRLSFPQNIDATGLGGL
jgi:hypothetical protein